MTRSIQVDLRVRSTEHIDRITSIDDSVRCLFGVECVEASPTGILVRRQINARESEVQRLDGGLSASRPMAHGFQRYVWSHHTRRTRSIESHWLAPIASSISHRPSNVNRSKRISCFLHGIPVSMRRAQATVTLLNEPILLLIRHCHSFYVLFRIFLWHTLIANHELTVLPVSYLLYLVLWETFY